MRRPCSSEKKGHRKSKKKRRKKIRNVLRTWQNFPAIGYSIRLLLSPLSSTVSLALLALFPFFNLHRSFFSLSYPLILFLTFITLFVQPLLTVRVIFSFNLSYFSFILLSYMFVSTPLSKKNIRQCINIYTSIIIIPNGLVQQTSKYESVNTIIS